MADRRNWCSASLKGIISAFSELDQLILDSNHCDLTPIQRETYDLLLDALRSKGYNMERARGSNYYLVLNEQHL